MAGDFTDKQRRFVQEYLVDYNGTRAAIAAGYSENCARQIAAENLAKPNISAAIAEGLAAQADRTRITADTVLGGLWREARSATKPSDRLRALELIGKHYAMFTDRVEHGGELPSIRLELVDDE